MTSLCIQSLLTVMLLIGVQYHGTDGFGDVPDAPPSAASITLAPQQGMPAALVDISCS